MNWLFLIPSLLFGAVQVDLQEPSYAEGKLETNSGGLVTADDLKIQAKSITYQDDMIIAEGNLLAVIGNQIYVADKLVYDTKTHVAIITNGRTQKDLWFIGGRKITVDNTRDILIEDPYFTTEASEDYLWSITANEATMSEEGQVKGNGMKVRLKNTPIFYFPWLRYNFKPDEDPAASYGITWDRGQGPKGYFRYRLLSWEYSDIYGRVDFRTNRGFAGAIETNYKSEDKRSVVQTKNYLAHDTFWNDDNPNRRLTRYRLQGLMDFKSETENNLMHFVYDKYSDRNMPSDFPSDDFELKTAKSTHLYTRNKNDYVIVTSHFRPRLNYFQNVNQELPAINLNVHPLSLPKLGILFHNTFEGSYLKYKSAKEIRSLVPTIQSGRFETAQKLERPFSLKFVEVNPQIGFKGIYYTNGPQDRQEGQALFFYGGEAHTQLSRSFTSFRHVIRPYLRYQGITNPTAGNPYIFSIADGWRQMREMHIGLLQSFYLNKVRLFLPNISFDLSGYTFFHSSPLKKGLPYLRAHLDCAFPSLSFFNHFSWNFENKTLDYNNAGVKWTASEDIAIYGEFRHRGKYYWRKNQYDNFILNANRTQESLLNSPLSDKRNTLLTRLQVRLSPNWVAQAETHAGWGRTNQPTYNSIKVNLITPIAHTWNLTLTYMHTVRDDQVSFDITLIDK